MRCDLIPTEILLEKILCKKICIHTRLKAYVYAEKKTSDTWDVPCYTAGLEITAGQWTMSGQNRALSEQIGG